MISPAIPDANVAAGATWINDYTTDGMLNGPRRASFKKWWVGIMINQDRSIRERLTLFWADYFGTETNTIGIANFVYGHHAMLRQNCLGNFKQLVKNVTIDPGMLVYLNGYLNTNTAPDENYARELQELFTLGKGPGVAYTEADVRTAAKVLTGWRINQNNYTVFFDPAKHDNTDKQFSSYYENTIVGGQAGANGALETDALIDMIFQNDEVSKYICRSLYRWFIYYKIDAAAETNVIEPLATIFRNNNYDIKPVLSALLKSEHFFDVMNQDIGDPPDVFGWPAYYQGPQFHELWINSDTLPKRNQFTDIMTNNGFTRNGKKIMIDAVAFTETLSNPSDPNILISDALDILYRVPLSDPAKQQIKEQILLSNQTQDYYWTNAWNAYLANPSDQAAYNVVNMRLKALYQYLMNLSEYQLS